MTMNIRSRWHVDGTRASSTWKRGGRLPEIWGRHTAEAVPLRATTDSSDRSVSAESSGYQRSYTSSGTERHASPWESVRVHGRA